MNPLDPEKAVFLNCPFDPEFRPIFDALVFASVCCGFTPRSALETGSVAVPRMERIVQAIFTSRYSIHDLSRCRGEGDEQLARFDMPLELGIAMARRFMTTGQRSQHDWFLLVPQGHLYARFISDLAGFDPARYSGTPESVVPRVVSWLCSRPNAAVVTTPLRVLAVLPQFRQAHGELQAQWQSEAPWSEILRVAADVAGRGLAV